LQKKCFASKRNEAKRDPFRFEFFTSDQSKIKRAYFRFVSLPKIFVSLLFCFVFASFHFRFASDAKTSEKTLFLHRSEKNFASVSHHFASKRKLWQFFASASLHFASKRKLWQFSLLFRFVFASFHFVSLQISTFRIDSKQAKKHFFGIEAKKFRFRFASLRFEAKMTAHPTFTH
jgi:hypothetical protein